MKIGIDARLWDQSGIGRYIRNLVFNLLELDRKNEYVLFVLAEDETKIKNQISNSKLKTQNSKIVPVNIPWHSFSEQLRFPQIINRENLDLMHFTYQQGVPVLYRRPFIVTIHDLILHHFMTGKSSTNPLWLYGFKMLTYRLIINNVARKAKKIIAVSNATREEIFDHLLINKNKIEVIYEAADDFRGNGKKINLSNYFLFVGNVYPHKDTDTLIKAFKTVAKEKNVKLVFVGEEDFISKKLKKGLTDMVTSNHIIFAENAPDDALSSYYQNAICLIRPSLMEGFSLPPLEALANKCLVIASDIPVHREILGYSIIYFKPKDADDLAKKINEVLNLDKIRKEKLLKKGLEKSKEFSWESTARQTLQIYESSLGL